MGTTAPVLLAMTPRSSMVDMVAMVLEFMVVLLLVLDMARERLLVDMVVTMATPLDPSAMPTLRGSATRGLSRTLARSQGRFATQSPVKSATLCLVKSATPLPMRSVSLWRSRSPVRSATPPEPQCTSMDTPGRTIAMDMVLVLLLVMVLDMVLVLVLELE